MTARIRNQLAQQIVDTLKTICNHDINFIDVQGRISASTNPARVGEYHFGGTMLRRAGRSSSSTGMIRQTAAEKTFPGEYKALVAPETLDLINEELDVFKKYRQFRSGDAYYKVLSNGNVTYLKPASRDIEGVTVSNQVKKGRFFFKVIKASNNAFRDCKNLQWAVISKILFITELA